MLAESKVLMGSDATSNTPTISIRIIPISTWKSRRDALPNAVDVNLLPPSCSVSCLNTIILHSYLIHHRLPCFITGGPTKIDCSNGRCTNFTTTQLDCGTGIEAASEAYGSFHVPLHDGVTVYSLYGFEGINNVGTKPILIPKLCSLDCSGCRQHGKKKNNNRLRSNGIFL